MERVLLGSSAEVHVRRSGRNARASVINSRTPAPLVLVVDDYAATREMYFRYLTSKGMRVLVAGEGLTALRLAEREQPDVIVMDLSLPLLDGWEAIWRLKGNSRTAHIPIIACTGNVVGGSGERAIAAGCDAYVIKPCLPEQLFEQILGLLARNTRRQRPA
jgi:two-component system cell cycle response regulator DivK